MRQRVLDLIAQLPDPDPRALHALGDALGGSEPQTLAAFIDWSTPGLSRQLEGGAPQAKRMNALAQAWD